MINIIVLLIFSGVTLNILLGKNGIINRAKTAKEEYRNSVDYENKKLEQFYSKLLLADSNGTSLENVDMTTLKQLILNTTYPIGSIYITTSNTNPASTIGGEWEQYAQGRTLVGIDDSQTEFNSVEKTGGIKSFNNTHTHTLGSGYAKAYHFNGFGYKSKETETWKASWRNGEVTMGSSGLTSSSGIELGGTTDSAGTEQSVLQPYIVTYMWKRTK